jgi:hypothetical protein
VLSLVSRRRARVGESVVVASEGGVGISVACACSAVDRRDPYERP